MRCIEFVGAPGSGSGGAQPFRVAVMPAATLAMDFHAHLNMDEVGGLLGGSYDEATATLRWAPCASLLVGTTVGGNKQPALQLCFWEAEQLHCNPTLCRNSCHCAR